MNREQQALLDAIRAFKPEGISDLEAALNVVRNHAMTIAALHRQLKGVQEEIGRVSRTLEELRAAMSPVPKDA